MKQTVSFTLGATCGQDLIELALMAGFVAMAAGAAMPGVASSISAIFSQVNSVIVIIAPTGADS
jgi:pilus assembly protein Flp/PilA